MAYIQCNNWSYIVFYFYFEHQMHEETARPHIQTIEMPAVEAAVLTKKVVWNTTHKINNVFICFEHKLNSSVQFFLFLSFEKSIWILSLTL